jgi:DNA replication licensing factor MCM6
MCLNPVCENRERWSLQLARSVFVDWQVLRVQENPSEIPAGSMPRNMRIIVRNETVEAAKPGDKCTFTGSLIVVPDVAQFGLARAGGVSMRKKTVARDGITGVSGLKQLGARDLTYTMCFLACDVKSHASRSNLAEQEEENFDNFSAFERETIMRIRRTPKLYQKMIKY